ncbi:BMP family ABC transporter substrate-binding protein [Sneathia sanguinegens]|jgi:hypothetical protein|uniref:BMP family lipoprotein n=1 Tax=Sneathia sanguinegens TaxID=40543 RepID=UPI0025868E66|nr:BMP family ABC transporter substrate-binding protein [Sneathia sanguinegens]MDU4653139.1 BMP family ABC transporter substrate-binding protein [Sneathia sanguinegens]
MKKILAFMGTVLTLITLVSCKPKEEAKAAEAKAPASTKKVAIVYSTGGKGDKSFNDSAYRGLQMAKDKLGIEFSEYEPKDPSAEAQNQLFQYAEKGEYELIIGVGFTMKDAVVAAAKAFPDQKFALVDDEISDLPNVVSLLFKEQEGSFLLGAMSAMVTKTNTLGFVGGVEAPVIWRFQAGFEQGAKYINPNIKILPVFINGNNPFNDPQTAKTLTETLIGKNADIVFQVAGASGSGVFQAAKEKGVYALGVDSNQDGEEPGVILTSMVKRVDNAVFNQIKDTLDGNFKSGIKYFGLKEDGVGTTDFEFSKKVVTEEIRNKIKEIAEKIKSGEIKVSDKVQK